MTRLPFVLVTALALPLSSSAVVLDYRPDFSQVTVGGPVNIEVYAVSSDGQNTPFSAIDIVVTWNPTFLGTVTALDSTSQYAWGASGFRFPTLNGNLSDGNAEWSAERQLFSPAPVATPAGLRLTTFRFTTLAPTSSTTTVSMPLTFSGRTTRVFSAFIPNTNILTAADPGALVRVLPIPPVNQVVTLPLFFQGAVNPFAATRTMRYSVLQGTTTVVSSTNFTATNDTQSVGITIPASVTGPVTIEVDGSQYLKRKITATLTGANQILSPETVIPGDVNNDTEVDLTDIDLIIADYLGMGGSTEGTITDLNNSGEVDLTDIDLAIGNYLLSDD